MKSEWILIWFCVRINYVHKINAGTMVLNIKVGHLIVMEWLLEII